MIWNIAKRKVTDLKSYEKNPRKFTKKGLADLKESILKCGDANIITINLDNTVLGGHARLKVMKSLGIKDVDVKVPERLLTEDEIQEVVIRLNANTAGEWDIEKLDCFFDKEKLGDWGLDIDFELSEKKEVLEDDIPVTFKAITKRGDLIKLGNHFLICGDCTESETLAKLMGDVSGHLLITDPPYNVDYEGKTSEKLKIKNDKMGNDDFYNFLVDSMSTVKNYLRDGSSFYIFHADSEGLNFRQATTQTLGKVRQCLIWLKNSIVMGRQDYHWRHEPILYGWIAGDSHLWNSDRKQSTILEFDRPTKSAEHPTMKPIKLFDYLIKNNTRKDDIVVDIFAGSGTTLITCEQNGRVSYNVELDPHYCDIIIARYEKLTGIKAIVL